MPRREDIIFVVNPSLWYDNMYPSGLLCLSGYLKKMGFDNFILDSQLSQPKVEYLLREKLLLERIIRINPRVVCFSASHLEFDEVVRINYALKKADKDLFTIVGGPQPTYRFADFLNNGFDFAAIGEGEITLHEFVREIFKGSAGWGSINGLAWKDKGRIILNPARELMSEFQMNSIDALPYDKIDPRYFNINIGTVRGLPLKGALLLTSRGCPYNCSYCGCNLIFGKKPRFRSLEKIEEEVKLLKEKFAIEGLWIVDDTFTVKKEHAIGVARVLKKYGLIWGCQSRVDTINEELMIIMRESGCVQIDFGVESGNQRILDEIIGKKTNIAQIKEAFALAKKHKIRTLANFMLGFPTETYQEFKDTEKVADLIDADVYIFAIATPLPGTRLYELVNEDIKPAEYSFLNWNGSELSERLNKSGIKNLSGERLRLHRKYFLNSLVKSIFSLGNYRFFLKREYKLRRAFFVFGLFFKYLKQFLLFVMPARNVRLN
ncbi:MAG: radical SAM protein [Candidatus Omnitrophota bacterium]